jgi:DNA-binding FadR family transcriptional regulator
VLDYIRGEIAKGHLGPGDKLPNEKELAASLGLSRTPMREAMKILAAMRECIERFRKLSLDENASFDDLLKADLDFHRAVYAAARNKLIIFIATPSYHSRKYRWKTSRNMTTASP